jgi:hypothetical protein
MIFFAKELDEFTDKDIENSSFFLVSQDDWGKYEFAAAWSAIAMATTKHPGANRVVVAVSPRGAYWEVDPETLEEVSGVISSAENTLRAATTIDHTIYACGMGRTVLCRRGPGNWVEVGPSELHVEVNSVIGFEDLAGFSVDDMYAVGWLGEIWCFKNGTWRQIDSPVSANLNAVFCAPDGKVYIVGDDGVMLRGRDDVWEVLETDRTDNLMDVAHNDNTIYVSTDFEILKLDNGTLVAEDAFEHADDVPATCLHLLSAVDGLVSMGPKDLFRLHAGVWERLV